MPLIDRQKQIPGGMFFYQPETKWKSRQWASFDQIVQDLIAHRKGNAALAAKHNWSTDPGAVAVEVDNFLTRVCQAMGWRQYILEGGGAAPPIPFPPPPPRPILPQRLTSAAVASPKPGVASPPPDQSKIGMAAAAIKRIWSGVRTLNDWLDSGEPAVDSGLSTLRAATCEGCPKNVPGDFTTWFTRPASEAIRRQLEAVQQRNLSTPSDEKLNVCEACLCPMKLKVHTPLTWIKKHLSEDTITKLKEAPNCWIIKELGS